MRSAKTLFVIAATAALVGISAAAVAAQTSRSMPDTSASPTITNRLEKAAREEVQHSKAMAGIRSFMKNGSLAVDYIATSSNPYSEDSLMETYADDKGNEYWVDPATDVLVQAGPGASADPQTHSARPSIRLPVAALRQQALAMIMSQMPDFAKRKNTLHPLEDNKDGEIYFFRWDDFASPVKESDMPPFIQVGLMADGGFASYTNTLAR